jgi:hypothetical protein
MPEHSKPKMEHQVDRLYIINQDSTDSVAIVALDAINRNITFYDANRQVLKVDTLTNYTLARWISPDPYGQFSSPYLGMGNNPVSGVDPDGGWSSRDAFLIGFGVGAAGTAIIAKNNGASDMSAFGLALLGGLAVGGGAAWLNNVGHFPSLDLSTVSPVAFGATKNVVSVLINNSGSRNNISAILKSDGGRLGGHVAIVIRDQVYGFTSDKDNIIKSVVNSDPDGNGYNRLSIKLDTWHSKGRIIPHDVRTYPTEEASTRFDLPINDEQADKILAEIEKIRLNPPNYGTLRARCTSIAARILRAGKVIGNDSKRFQESPFQFRRYLNRKFTKVY